jgi:membrane protein
VAQDVLAIENLRAAKIWPASALFWVQGYALKPMNGLIGLVWNEIRPRSLEAVWDSAKQTGRYLMETEVHVYGFSIAANVLLAFMPFLVVMASLCRHVFGLPAAEQALYFAVADLFPDDVGKAITYRVKELLWLRGPLQVTSMFLLFFTANGIFEPLEVALNRAFNIRKNRSYFRNQLISLGLIFACGILIMISTVFTGMNVSLIAKLVPANSFILAWSTLLFFKIAAIPALILCLFLIYWLLPNGPVPIRRIIPTAVLVGLLLEVLKYLNLLLWPWLQKKLLSEYSAFYMSVSIVLFSFVGAMVVLGGAEWAARGAHPPKNALDYSLGPVASQVAGEP